MIKDNYCRAIYKGLFIALEPDNQARLAACCINKTGPWVDRIDFHNDAYLKQQREEFDQGIASPGCNFCWEKERSGIPSRRQRQCPPLDHGDPYRVELTELNYHVSPLCNAKCITCDSSQSSAWAAEDEKFGEIKEIHRSYNRIRKSDIDVFNIDFSRLEMVYFNGGEPFLSSDINRVLGAIKQQQGSLAGVTLGITTNSSIMPRPEDVVLWNECRQVIISCSIEAVGPAFEYIRYPLKWAEVSYNVANFHKLFKNVKIILTPNMGVHNALEYPKLVEWFESLPPEAQCELKPGLTYGVLNFGAISTVTKYKILDRLPVDPRYQALRDFITGSINGVTDQAWLAHLTQIDQRRNLNWRQSLQGLAEITDK